MKAIIPMAGAGTNLRPHTYTQPKPLIPVAGKPIIGFILDQLLEAGIDEFIFVIGYLGEKIRQYVEQYYPSINVEYVQQAQRQGLGHAIWATRELLASADDLVIILGDTIVDVNFDNFLGMETSCLGVRKVEDPRSFGVVESGEEGYVARAIEKPSIPKSNLALVGLYKIREVAHLVEALHQIITKDQRTHGEYQLTDALMMMIKNGVRFTTIEVNNWFDCGRKEILLETNATLLDRKKEFANGLPDMENTIVIPPVSIGMGCKVKNAIIGPHVSIGDNAVIESAVVADSIIGSYSTLQEIVLNHSIIGQDAMVRGNRQQLNIGDNTEIDFG